MIPCLFSTILKDMPLDQVIRQSGRIGYRALEIRSISHLPVTTTAQRARDLAALAADAGVRLRALYVNHGGYSKLSDEQSRARVEQIRRYAALAAQMGVSYLKDHPGGPSAAQASAEHFERGVTWMRRAARAAAESGVRLLIEMHHGNLAEDTGSALRLVEAIDEPAVGLIYDPGNMHIVPAPYGPQDVHALGKHIWHVHVKDTALRGDPEDANRHCGSHGMVFWNRLLGEGEVDHTPLVKALREIGYAGCLSAECQVVGLDPIAVAEHEYAVIAAAIRTAGGSA